MKQQSNIMKQYILPLIGLSSIVLTSNALATIPVIDYTALMNAIKEYKQLKTQYDLLHNTYTNAKEQLDEAKDLNGKAKSLVSDAEGHYNFGSLLNGNDDLKSREWSPDKWQDALKGVAGGNPARYQELLTQYKNAHPTLSADEYAKGASKDSAKTYQDDVKVNQAASVNASYAFNDIKKHLDNIHNLSEQIEKAPNTKAAIDLNSRLVAETAYIQTQELKMQSLQNEQLAQQTSSKIDSESASAKFNKLPDE